MKSLFKRIGPLVLVLMVLLATGQAATAQVTVAVKLDSVDVSQFPTVVGYATVIDENGLPVIGLKAEQFELIEDGKASFPPTEAQAITNDKAAVSVLILIDLSETMDGEPLQAAKDATAKFLEKLLNEGNDPDRAAFIGFGQEVDIKAVTLTESQREVPFTNDTGKLLNVVNFLQVERGSGTPLYDAVYRAVKIASQQPGRRAIIVMTDGSDVGSTLKQDDPIDEARRQRIPVFPIGLSNRRLDKTYLGRLAELTGGQYQEAPSPDEIGQKFEQVLAQLKVQYKLSFQSRIPQTDGQYHSLLLRVNTPRGQGFDETKFQLGQPQPTAALAATVPAPGSTALPLPTVTPIAKRGDEGMSGGIIDWITQNTLLAAGIVGAALLLLLLLIVFVILLMRRRSSAQPEQAWGGEPYPAATPGWPSGETTPGTPAYGGGVDYGAMAPVEMAPPTGAGTQIAPPTPPTSSPFGAPPPAQPFAPPPQPFGAPPPASHKPAQAEPPAAGGTVVIQRGPKPKVLGMLVDRKHSARRHDFEKTITVGRAPGNTIVIDNPTVSRQHATIKLEGTDFRLYDLGSANGTFVGDPPGSPASKRIREPVMLQDGMLVRFGEIEFTFKRMSLE